jgi:hypothetical protein
MYILNFYKIAKVINFIWSSKSKKFETTFFFFLIIILLLFSGCLKIQPTTTCGEEGDCTTTYEPGLNKIMSCCNKIKRPIGYPLCSNNDCEKNFNSNFKIESDYFTPTIKSKIINTKLYIINSWEQANEATSLLSETLSKCDNSLTVFDFINNDLEGKSDEIKSKIGEFSEAYLGFNENYLLTLKYLAVYLEAEEVKLMPNSELYAQYTEINKILNEYLEKTGKEINVEDSSASSGINFYTSNFEPGNEITDFIKSEEIEKDVLPKNMLPSNTDITETNQNMSTELSIFLFSLSTGIGITSMLTFIPGGNGAFSLIEKFLGSAYSLTNKISSIIKVPLEKINNVFNNISDSSDCEQWAKVNNDIDKLNDFKNIFGPSSTILIDFYNKINTINSELKKEEENAKILENEILEKIEKLEKELNNKDILLEENSTIFEKFGNLENPNLILSKLNKHKIDLAIIKNTPLGYRFDSYINMKESLEKIELEIINLTTIDFEYLIFNCNSYLNNKKENISILNESENKQKQDFLIQKYFDEKDITKKMIVCNEFLKIYDDEVNYNCLNDLKTLNKNIDELETLDELDCSETLENKIIELENTDIYYNLENKVEEFEKYYNYITRLKIENCINYKKLSKYSEIYKKITEKTKFTNNNISSILLSDEYENTNKLINQYIEEMKIEFNNGLSCHFQKNYSIDLDEKIIEFYNFFDEENVSFEINLPLAKTIKNITTKSCLKTFNSAIKYVTLSFDCLEYDMLYNISYIQEEPIRKIKDVSVTLEGGTIIEEITFAGTNKTKIELDLQINPEYIIYLEGIIDNKKVNTSFNNEKIELFFNNLFNKEKTLELIYILNKPVELEYYIENVIKIDDITKSYYNIKIKNNLEIEIPKLKIILENIHNIEEKRIYATDTEFNSYLLKYNEDVMYFEIEKLQRMEEKEFKLIINSKDSQADIEDQIRNLEDILEDLLKNGSEKNKEEIKKLQNRLKNIKGINIKANPEIIKEISEIKKEAEKLKTEEIKTELLKTEYLFNLERLKSIKKSLEEIDLKELSKFKNYYNKDTDIPKDITVIQKTIGDAENKYRLMQIKEATNILKSYKENKGLENILEEIFGNLEKNKKDTEKFSKKLDITYSNIETNLNEISKKIQENISNGQYIEAINELTKYIEEIEIWDLKIEKELKNKKEYINELFENFNNTKSKLNLFWEKYNYLYETTKSEKFINLSNMGIKINFDNKNIKTLKDKLDKIGKISFEIEKEKNKTEIKLKENNKKSIIEFKEKSFEDYFEDFSNINNILNSYEGELRNKAYSELELANSKLAGKEPVELYKAKESFDKNKYVETIYLSKTALFGLGNENDNNWYLYLGIIFVMLIAILIVRYKKLFSSITKKNKKKKKITYYTVDREKE